MNAILENAILFIILALLFSCGFFLGYTLMRSYDLQSIPRTASKPLLNASGNCSNMSLPDAAMCYRDYISTFFNYTVRNDTEKTLEDIQQNGGDCYDYSLLYVRLAQSDGFRARKTVFIIDNDTSHAIAIISDEKYGYCVLDQISFPYCVALDLNSINTINKSQEEQNATLTL